MGRGLGTGRRRRSQYSFRSVGWFQFANRASCQSVPCHAPHCADCRDCTARGCGRGIGLPASDARSLCLGARSHRSRRPRRSSFSSALEPCQPQTDTATTTAARHRRASSTLPRRHLSASPAHPLHGACPAAAAAAAAAGAPAPRRPPVPARSRRAAACARSSSPPAASTTGGSDLFCQRVRRPSPVASACA